MHNALLRLHCNNGCANPARYTFIACLGMMDRNEWFEMWCNVLRLLYEIFFFSSLSAGYQMWLPGRTYRQEGWQDVYHQQLCLLSGTSITSTDSRITWIVSFCRYSYPGPGWCGFCRLLSHRICRLTHVQWHRVPYEYRKVKSNSSVSRFLRVRNESLQNFVCYGFL
jgi:hypothetical protein